MKKKSIRYDFAMEILQGKKKTMTGTTIFKQFVKTRIKWCSGTPNSANA